MHSASRKIVAWRNTMQVAARKAYNVCSIDTLAATHDNVRFACGSRLMGIQLSVTAPTYLSRMGLRLCFD